MSVIIRNRNFNNTIDLQRAIADHQVDVEPGDIEFIDCTFQDMTINKLVNFTTFLKCRLTNVHLRDMQTHRIVFDHTTLSHIRIEHTNIRHLDFYNSQLKSSLLYANYFNSLEFGRLTILDKVDVYQNYVYYLTHNAKTNKTKMDNNAFMIVDCGATGAGNTSQANLIQDLLLEDQQTFFPKDPIWEGSNHLLNLPQGTLIGYGVKPDNYQHHYLVTMEIPKEARRSRGTDNKCRAEFVKVRSIQKLYQTERTHVYIETNERVSFFIRPGLISSARPTIYEVGEITKADKWDDDRWETCTSGIHFFLTKEEALHYINH